MHKFIFILSLLLSLALTAEMEVKTTVLEPEQVPFELKNPVPVDAETLTVIRENALLVIQEFTEKGEESFSFDQDSIRLVEKEILANSSDMFVDYYGSYFGEAIIKAFDGKWVYIGDEPAVQTVQGQIVFPLGKIHKLYKNGEEDSIYHFFIYLKESLSPQTCPVCTDHNFL